MKLTRAQLAWFEVCFYDMAEQHGWTREDAKRMYRTWVTFTRRRRRADWRHLPVLSSRVKHRAKKAPQKAAAGEATSRKVAGVIDLHGINGLLDRSDAS